MSPINLHLPNARTPTGRSSHGPRRQTPDTEGARGRAFHHPIIPSPIPILPHLRPTMGWRALKRVKYAMEKNVIINLRLRSRVQFNAPD